MMTSRASCKQALIKPTAQSFKKPLMTIKKGGQSLPITDKMIGDVLQKLMAA